MNLRKINKTLENSFNVAFPTKTNRALWIGNSGWIYLSIIAGSTIAVTLGTSAIAIYGAYKITSSINQEVKSRRLNHGH